MKKFFTFLMFSFLGLFFHAQTQTKAPSEANLGIPQTVEELPDYAALQKRLNLKDVVTVADQEPEFPGGRKAYLYKISESMPILDIKSTKDFNATIYVIIEKDGYIRNYAAISNNKKYTAAAEEAVKKVFTRWKPAKVNGQPVRYIFYIPIRLKKW